MIHLRLIADDLTGALDSAAAFAATMGPVRVIWGEQQTGGNSLAFDSGTRERSQADAAARLSDLALFLAPQADRLSFFKVDSLLRGHAGTELLAVMRGNSFAHVVMASAIPFQGRITRDGRQMIREGDVWRATGEDIVATLRAGGIDVTLCNAGDALPSGVSFWHTASDVELDAVVDAARRAAGSILWVGAAGLAGALAHSFGRSTTRPTLPTLPLLGLIGTDHAVMQTQLAQYADDNVRIGDDVAEALGVIRQAFSDREVCFVTCDLPGGMARQAAQDEITRRFGALCSGLERPGCLFVSGGETLSALTRNLGATALEVYGEFEPGAPLSRLCGGHWDGVDIISKSGAFGTPDFLTRLVSSLSPSLKVSTS